jgi:thioredoxin-like negative regulator of GroEL
MTRLFIATALAALVALVTRFVDRRHTSHPLAVRRGALPTQVPAVEVGIGDGPAIIIFTESSCRSCQDAIRLIRGPAGGGISVADIEYGAQPDLHKRFGIDTVPTTVVVDEKGSVVAGWTGRVDLSELTLALAQVVQSELD